MTRLLEAMGTSALRADVKSNQELITLSGKKIFPPSARHNFLFSILFFEYFITLELFRTLTPKIYFLVRWMIEENNRRLNKFKENLEDIKNIIREP
jgi:hypothetical protein